eukprot:SAG11_NODE_32570_length_282_cov_1.289617_1_plen_31_part_01
MMPLSLGASRAAPPRPVGVLGGGSLPSGRLG